MLIFFLKCVRMQLEYVRRGVIALKNGRARL